MVKAITNHIQVGAYSFERKRSSIIGRSEFTKVYRGRNTDTGEDVVIKVLNKTNNEKHKEKVIERLEIHKRLIHKNIVRLLHYELIEDEFFIVYEFCDKGNLHNLLKQSYNVCDEELLKLMSECAASINLLHRQWPKIVHKNIRPKSFLVKSSSEVQILKLSLGSHWLEDGLEVSNLQAPELYGDEEVIAYGTQLQQVDIFSLGVLFLMMIIHKPREDLNIPQGDLIDLS